MSFAGDGQYFGLSGQEPAAGVGSGTRYTRRDTGVSTYWNGSAWVGASQLSGVFQTSGIYDVSGGGTSGIQTITSGSQIAGVISGTPVFASGTTVSGNLIATIDVDSAIVKNVGNYNAIIYSPISGTYVSRKRDGTLLSSGKGAAFLQGVVQAALDVGGRVSWAYAAGAYLFSNAVSGGGVYFPNFTTLTIDDGTIILPTADFSGSLFRIDDFTSGEHIVKHITVQGGMFTEGSATPNADWDLFRIESASDTPGVGGIVHVTLRDIWAQRCRAAVRFVCTTGSNSYINGNTFDNMWVHYPKKGFVFEQKGSGRSNNQIINRNHFTHIVVQADEVSGNNLTTNGFEDIGGEGNQFINCRVWDIVSGQSCCNITNMAYSTLIQGGYMTIEPTDWEIRNDFGYNTIVTADPFRVGQNASLANPFMRKTGTFQGAGATTSTTVVGDGLLNGLAVAGSGSVSTPTPTTQGTPKRMDTGTNSGSWEAMRSSTLVAYRNFNPFLKVKAQLGSGNMSGFRAFVGLANNTAIGIATGNDFLSGLVGWGIAYTSESGANWWFIRNAGTGADTPVDTGITANTSGHIFYFAAYENGPKVVWRIDNLSGQIGEASTTIPGQFTGLLPGVWIANSSGTSRIADVHMMYLGMEPGPQLF